MKRLSSVQILSVVAPFILGFSVLIVYISVTQNPQAAPLFYPNLSFLAISAILLSSPYFLMQTAIAHSKEKHLNPHQLLEPVVLSLLLVGFSLFTIFESVLLGVEGGGDFFYVRFAALLSVSLINLITAANLAASTNQSLKTARRLQIVNLLVLVLLAFHFASSFHGQLAMTAVLVFLLLNFIPQGIFYIFINALSEKIHFRTTQ